MSLDTLRDLRQQILSVIRESLRSNRDDTGSIYQEVRFLYQELNSILQWERIDDTLGAGDGYATVSQRQEHLGCARTADLAVPGRQLTDGEDNQNIQADRTATTAFTESFDHVVDVLASEQLEGDKASYQSRNHNRPHVSQHQSDSHNPSSQDASAQHLHNPLEHLPQFLYQTMERISISSANCWME